MNVLAVVAELGCIGEQIGERLDESRMVTDHCEARADIHAQSLSLSKEERSRDFHCLRRDSGDVDRLHVQLDASARDARHVQQVVDQAAKMCHLPIDQLQLLVVATSAPQDLERGHDRRQRIPQLVAQHRHELVFVVRLALGFASRLFVRARFGDVLAHDVAPSPHPVPQRLASSLSPT